jgi:hypothetical protein
VLIVVRHRCCRERTRASSSHFNTVCVCVCVNMYVCIHYMYRENYRFTFSNACWN